MAEIRLKIRLVMWPMMGLVMSANDAAEHAPGRHNASNTAASFRPMHDSIRSIALIDSIMRFE
jgi:hypothetical protein